MFVEMKVRGLALDQVSNMPIIILRDEEDKRSLQIWVGIFEANAIALALRVAAPIYVDEEVIRKAKSLDVTKETEQPVKADDPDQLREWLQNIKPEDFEKFNKA